MKTLVAINPPKVQNKTLSAVAGMVIVTDDIYVLASKSSDGSTKQPCVLHKLMNYLSGGGKSSYSVIQTEKGSTAVAVHANSLTYYNHVFYMATRNSGGNQIMGFGSDGTIKEKYKYPQSMIATINHYDKRNFLISVNGGLSVKYRMVRLENSTITNVGIEFRAIIPDEDFSTGNDSFYDKKDKRLYITKCNKDCTKNRVYVYDICRLYNGGKYYPEKTFSFDKKEKYEIEGVGIYGNKIYACVNGVKDGKQSDEIMEA